MRGLLLDLIAVSAQYRRCVQPRQHRALWKDQQHLLPRLLASGWLLHRCACAFVIILRVTRCSYMPLLPANRLFSED